MNILLFDVETTGLDPKKSFILSLGVVLWDNVTNKYQEFYQVLNWKKIMNNFSIPDATIKVHGITNEIMEDEGISPIQAFVNLHDFIKNFIGEEIIDVNVAFNLPFDQNMLRSNLQYLNIYNKNFKTDSLSCIKIDELLKMYTKKYNDYYNKTLFIDSMIIDKIFHFEVDGEKVKHNLAAVGKRYGLEEDPNAHNAIADTRRLFELFKIQLKELQELGIDLNEDFEKRLIEKYKKEQEYWAKKNKEQLDYLGFNMSVAQ